VIWQPIQNPDFRLNTATVHLPDGMSVRKSDHLGTIIFLQKFVDTRLISVLFLVTAISCGIMLLDDVEKIKVGTEKHVIAATLCMDRFSHLLFLERNLLYKLGCILFYTNCYL